MSWIFLTIGIVFEVLGTTCLKMSEGFTKLWPSLGIAVFYAIGLAMLTLSLKKIEISVAYAIWSGMGTALISIIGLYYFQESMNLMKAGSLALVILGVVGLNLSTGGP